MIFIKNGFQIRIPRQNVCLGQLLINSTSNIPSQLRIIAKAVMIVVKPDIATAYDQLCSGLEVEVAVHAVSDLYELYDTNGFIQVDASNDLKLDQ